MDSRETPTWFLVVTFLLCVYVSVYLFRSEEGSLEERGLSVALVVCSGATCVLRWFKRRMF